MHDTKQRLKGRSQWSFWSDYTEEYRELLSEEPSITVPYTVESLASTNELDDQVLSREFARLYLSLVRLAHSFAMRDFAESNLYVANAYEALLLPYTLPATALEDSTIAPELAEFLSALKGTGTCDCDACTNAYLMLDVQSGTDASTVRSAYRDLAKVWHPYKFSDSDIRLKAKAEEKFKKIQAAYAKLQEHGLQDSMGPNVGAMSLLEAVDYTVGRVNQANDTFTLLNRCFEAESQLDHADIALAVRHGFSAYRYTVEHLQCLISREDLPAIHRTEIESTVSLLAHYAERLAKAADRIGINEH